VIDKYLDQIADLTREAEPTRARGRRYDREGAAAIFEFLFGQQGFDGNRDAFGDPRNSFLNDVLERRLGIPITLAVLYIEIGRRLGLNLSASRFRRIFWSRRLDERRRNSSYRSRSTPA